MTIYLGENATVEYGTPEFEAAKAELKEKVDAFEAALSEAEALADKYGLEFTIQPAYGMGGAYTGKGDSEQTEQRYYDDYGDGAWGWFSSSESC